ncbi:MAG: glutaminyl-peptide cyclotransferase [Pyrinomonadaceae bacterium]
MTYMTLFRRLKTVGLNGAMRRGELALLLIFATLNVGCQTGANANLPANPQPANANVKAGYQIVNVFPHDADAYTQGLVFTDGVLLESTGREGHSSLRRVEVQTGRVLNQVNVPRPYFAEGLALLNGKLYQLTWQHGVGFIYDAASLIKLGEFNYSGEGWGLTADGSSLILSDGSHRIRFLDPETFATRKTINVLDSGRVIDSLNELEFIKGEIFANIWHNDRIARIDPNTGRVNGWINLAGLREASGATVEEGVLNGIAYDAAADRLFVTGKLWPKLFEIRVKQD